MLFDVYSSAYGSVYNSSTNLFLMPKSSTSKIKVDSGGMTGGWPRTPGHKHLFMCIRVNSP
jgi:hypothetical protein